MKHLFISAMALSSLFIAACGNNETASADHTQHDQAAKKDSIAAEPAPANLATLSHSFTQVDAQLSTALETIWQHYYHIQFALSKDDANEAGNGGLALAEAMAKVNKATMPADQKALYEKNEEDLRMHAQHMAENTGNIKHQREHFQKMSADVYDLLKGFGAGNPVYKTYCPMAFNNKGAFWISTATEVKNPYFGKDMLTCGEVQELIK